jgi:malonyl-CoA O-methyltransferase
MSLAKTKIKQSFAAASSGYDDIALLQRNVGIDLLQHVVITDPVGTMVDLGCGTCFLINELLEQNKPVKPEQVIALDIAMPMLQTARTKLKNSWLINYICADVECLPLQSHVVDLVLSNLAFQWCGNLDEAFNEVKRLLKPGGQFVFTTFGANTLHELKAAWQEVDDYTHVNTFCSVAQLTDHLQHAGFLGIELTSRPYVSTYESVWDLMAELKQLGAHTVMAGANKRLTTRSAMQRMICAYHKQDENGLIPATFEVISAMVKA